MTNITGKSRRDFLQAAALCATAPVALSLASARVPPRALTFELPADI